MNGTAFFLGVLIEETFGEGERMLKNNPVLPFCFSFSICKVEEMGLELGRFFKDGLFSGLDLPFHTSISAQETC